MPLRSAGTSTAAKEEQKNLIVGMSMPTLVRCSTAQRCLLPFLKVAYLIQCPLTICSALYQACIQYTNLSRTWVIQWWHFFYCRQNLHGPLRGLEPGAVRDDGQHPAVPGLGAEPTHRQVLGEPHPHSAIGYGLYAEWCLTFFPNATLPIIPCNICQQNCFSNTSIFF